MGCGEMYGTRRSTPDAAAAFRSRLSEVWGRQRVHGRVRRGASRMVGVTVRTRGCMVGGRSSKGESWVRENEDSQRHQKVALGYASRPQCRTSTWTVERLRHVDLDHHRESDPGPASVKRRV